MSVTSNGNDLQSYGNRWASALRRRLKPHTALTVQQFAHVMRVSERIVWGWLSGQEPRGRYVMEAMRFFDGAFAAELTGRPVTRLADVRAQLDRVEELLREQQELLSR